MSGGGIQRYSLMRLFAGDADVEWVTGWVDDDPWSDEDQGGAGYVRFVNGIEGFIHRQGSVRQGYEVLCSRGLFVSDGAYVHAWKLAEGAARPTADALRPIEGVLPQTHLYRGRGNARCRGLAHHAAPGRNRSVHGRCARPRHRAVVQRGERAAGAGASHRLARITPARPYAGVPAAGRPQPEDDPQTGALGKQEDGIRQRVVCRANRQRHRAAVGGCRVAVSPSPP